MEDIGNTNKNNDIWEFIKTLDIVSETDGDGIWIAYERGKREVWAGATKRENAIGKLALKLYLELKVPGHVGGSESYTARD